MNLQISNMFQEMKANFFFQHDLKTITVCEIFTNPLYAVATLHNVFKMTLKLRASASKLTDRERDQLFQYDHFDSLM